MNAKKKKKKITHKYIIQEIQYANLILDEIDKNTVLIQKLKNR